MQEHPRSLAPVLAVLYLGTVAVAAFFITGLPWLGALLSVQVVLGLAVRTPPRALLRPFAKLKWFSVFIVLSYGLLGYEEGDATVTVPYWPWPLSVTGLVFGAAMVLRVLSVVVASTWVRRQGEPGDFVTGLRSLGMPDSLALLLDRSLQLLDASGEGGMGGGRGDGSGGGRRHRGAQGGAEPDISFRRVLRGDMTLVVDAIESGLRKAARLMQQEGGSDNPKARDITVLAGLLLVMLSLKALKVLPGLPFAPGHKGIILIPIYILAAELTSLRNGATLLGVAFGLLSFLFGDGRYGVFEIAKHITPGLLADGCALILRKRERGVLTYALVGMLIAVGRWATIALVILMIDAPPKVVAILAPVGLVHLFFGALSGWVSRVLVRAAARLNAAFDSAARDAMAVDAGPSDDVDRLGRGSGRGDGSGGGRNRRAAGGANG